MIYNQRATFTFLSDWVLPQEDLEIRDLFFVEGNKLFLGQGREILRDLNHQGLGMREPPDSILMKPRGVGLLYLLEVHSLHSPEEALHWSSEVRSGCGKHRWHIQKVEGALHEISLVSAAVV